MVFNHSQPLMIKIAIYLIIILIVWPKYSHGQGCQQIKLAVTLDWFPISYSDPQQPKPQGIAFDLIQHIGKKLAVPVIINTELPWKRLLVYLKNGEIDLSPAIYYTTTRDQFYQYSIPYFDNQARVFVLKDQEFAFSTLDDLIGRDGSTTYGGSFGEEFDAFMIEHQLKIVEVATTKQLARMLLMGRIDYLVQDYLEMSIYLKQQDLADKIVALPRPVSHSKVHVALSRRSPCAKLMPQINEIISQAKQDGTLQTIIDKYIK